MKEKIVELATTRPLMSLADIGRETGTTGEYVRQVLKKAGVKKPRSPIGGERSTSRLPKIQPPRHPHLLNHLNVGAISELSVCADLMKHGYIVFRSVAPHAACDILCFHQTGTAPIYRVEVRSARRLGGALRYAVPQDEKRYDILALCLPSGEVVYKPELPLYAEQNKKTEMPER